MLQSGDAIVWHRAVDPKGKVVASGDADGEIKLWDVKKGELLLTLPGSEDGAVSGVAFVDKGKTLATARGTAAVTLWGLSDLRPWGTLRSACGSRRAVTGPPAWAALRRVPGPARRRLARTDREPD